MSITVITKIFDQSIHSYDLNKKDKTIGEICSIGKYYRHPDSALVSYSTAVEKPLGHFPEGRDYNIAIIGGGASGITALYELSGIARDLNKINITLYESDPDHFTTPSTRSVNTKGKRAGRIFAARTRGTGEDHSVYEIGAMRFPEIAGLTWHYASAVFGDHEKAKVFPNPGKVPTEFVFGDRVDRYIGPYWLDNDSPTKAISKVIIDGIAGTEQEFNISLYPLGCKDPVKISNELKNKDTSTSRLREIQQQWKNFINAYDGITLESVCRQTKYQRKSEMPSVDKRY